MNWRDWLDIFRAAANVARSLVGKKKKPGPDVKPITPEDLRKP